MKKISQSLFLFHVLVLLFSCKEKKKAPTEAEKYFPVLSFIKSQVAQVDTSLYSIRKITYIDSVRTDTTHYKREQFRELAADFLNLPDLADPKYQGRFVEKRTFDTALNRAMFILEPLKPEEEEIKRQEVLIRPDPPNDKITNIIIDYIKGNRDSSIQKKLLWQVDRSFQVTSIRQLPGQKEIISTYKVIWNEEDNE